MSNVRDLILLAKNKRLQKLKAPKKKLSYNAEFFISFVSAISVLSITMVFTIFRTNMIYNYDADDLISTFYEESFLTSIASVMSSTNAVSSNSNKAVGYIPGIGNIVTSGNGKSKCKVFDVYSYDKDLYEFFAKGEGFQWGLNANRTIDDNEAKAMSALYTYCIQDKTLGHNAACGLIANVCQEGGSPGIKEVGKYPPAWPSGHDFIDTKECIDSVMLCGQNPSNKIGFGMCAWTWYTFLPEYANVLYSYCLSDGTLPDDDRRAADLDYLITTVLPKYKSVMDMSSPRLAAETWCKNYERPKYSLAWISRGIMAEDLSTRIQKFKHK